MLIQLYLNFKKVRISITSASVSEGITYFSLKYQWRDHSKLATMKVVVVLYNMGLPFSHIQVLVAEVPRSAHCFGNRFLTATNYHHTMPTLCRQKSTSFVTQTFETTCSFTNKPFQLLHCTNSCHIKLLVSIGFI